MDTIKRRIIKEEVKSYTTFWGKYSEEIVGAIAFIAGIGLVWFLLVIGI